MPTRRQPLLFVLLIVLLLAGAWWAYHPGLTGGFQFDDFANLPVLGATGPVDDWATFWRYITSGNADPTGRPIALLSFLIDARNWPASPQPFLRTNIVLHLINGVLLFWLLWQLGRTLVSVPVEAHLVRDGLEACSKPRPSRTRCAPTTRRAGLAALLGAALWLLHPLFVSTTLYIVQREAMLPVTFVLAGLLMWLRGRTWMLDGHTSTGLVWMLLGLGGCTFLAVLSKANGILLPALALTVEYTVLRHPCHWTTQAGKPADVDIYPTGILGASTETAARRYRWTLAILAWLPACLVAAYLLHRGWDGFVQGTGRRPWTLGQRLLTEPRVLMDYLQLLWMPRPFTPGLFNDQIHASTSLLAPWTTLPCLLAVLGLIVGALLLRKRWPVLALAVLFYFVGQALESSTIALELYFEHRNYLPALLMFWPLALWVCGVRQCVRNPVGAHLVRDSLGPEQASRLSRTRCAPTGGRWRDLGKGLLAVALLVSLGAMTHVRASVWGNIREQALLWARLNPESPRAQANAALSEMHAGQPLKASRHLRRLLKQKPDQVQLALNLFAAECSMGHVTDSTMQAAKTALATTSNPGALLTHWFDRAIGQTLHPTCPQLTLSTIEQLLAAARSNPQLMAIDGRRQDLFHLQGLIALKRRHPDQALADFKHALDQDVRPTAAFEQVALLGSHGYPRRGLALLHYYETDARQHIASPAFGMPRIHVWVMHREHYWQHELKHLRHTLQQDAAARRQKIIPTHQD